MDLSIVNNPSQQEKDFIINELWNHNALFHPVDIKQFLVNITDKTGEVKAGLIAQTWWDALEIQYLWVSEENRGKGYGKKMIIKAENVARDRQCHMAYVDTFDFQAKKFYEKFGYEEYGSLAGYAKKFQRHYLSKALS